MSTVFDIKRLIQKAHFGYIDTPFPEFKLNKLKTNKEVDAMQVGHSSSGKDLLGRPYFMDFHVTIPSESKNGKGEKYRLPNEPLVAITQKNNIKKTEVIGRDRFGTVKEFIANDDYGITIYGVCYEKDRYPTEQVKKLNEIASFRGALDVENDLLRLFGIYSICIESLDIDEMIGEPYSQRYRIQAISDTDFLAELQERKKIKSLY